MILASLALKNFRSYTSKTFIFDPGSTLIVGPNTAGKTNILEAIMLMATGKSFRAEREAEVIAWDAEMLNAKCQMTNDENLELFITRGEVSGQKAPHKKYLVNGIARRGVDFIGNLRAVLFWPEDLELVTDSPSLRRRYLDSVLVQVDYEYRRNLLSYERGLRQRNKLLDLISEGRAHRHQLIFWDQLLISAGGYITDKRAELIDYVNQCQMPNPPAGRAGAKCQIEYEMQYDKSVISPSRLEQYKDAEIGARATLVGPHRDDFSINKWRDGRLLELSKYGSRGEQRLSVLWLKLAELSYLEKKSGERPILLLDDIFSELDEDHRKLVLNLLGKQQTILTCADIENIPPNLRKEMKMIQLAL